MVRFDDNTFMKLREIARSTGNNYSVVVRSLVMRQLDELTDTSGNLKLDGQTFIMTAYPMKIYFKKLC